MSDALREPIKSLGRCTVASPLDLSRRRGDGLFNYVDDAERVLYSARLGDLRAAQAAGEEPAGFELAGPRERLYFDPSKARAAIVTCGGLCPGINDVIRALVMGLWHRYGVRRIVGVRYGYSGLLPEEGHELIDLNPDLVEDIHTQGGTILGSSRGGGDAAAIVDALERLNVNIFFTIGGDGTQRGAHAIHTEATRRGLKMAVIGIPKTIDNDLALVERSFGHETAFSLAVGAIAAANREAEGAYNGVGLVKLMGRHSGFIAAKAALAMNVVNFVLIPEVPVDLDGPAGFLAQLRERLVRRHHAVVCVAEGAGQEWLAASGETDASGNRRLGDVGAFLKARIAEDLAAHDLRHSVKYIDPSYMIRSAPAVPNDSVFCSQLGHNAVHAAMAGKTDVLIGAWNGHFTHVPLRAVVHETHRVSPEGPLWWSVLEATGQPARMIND